VVNRDVNIISLDVNCQPDPKWQLSGHYAGKLVLDNSDAHDDVSHAHLLIGRMVRDLTSKVDIGVNLSTLIDGNGRSLQYGVGPEVGVTLAENLRLGLGYNFSGFTDEDLTEEEYTQHGFYIALRLKFDEQLFHRRKEDQ
jgi:opacity protein-like surface antigen